MRPSACSASRIGALPEVLAVALSAVVEVRACFSVSVRLEVVEVRQLLADVAVSVDAVAPLVWVWVW